LHQAHIEDARARRQADLEQWERDQANGESMSGDSEILTLIVQGLVGHNPLAWRRIWVSTF
jgi:hypothetical protein